jgi:hypothetical protein
MKRLIIPAIAVWLSVACTQEKPAEPAATGSTPANTEVAATQEAAQLEVNSFHAPLRDLESTHLSSIPTGRRDFRRDPPQVADVVMEPTGTAGTVRLLVRFAERGLPNVIPMETETAPVALRDDGTNGDERAGDGLFTATTQLPPEFVRERTTVAADVTSRRAALGPIFRNRRMIAAPQPPAPPARGIRILSPFDFPGPPPAPVVNSERSLLVRDPKVVGDKTRTGNPCVAGSNAVGPWSFASLMREMANQPVTGVTPSQFARKWLDQWLAAQAINGPPVPARPNMNNVIQQWLAASGGANLDLTKAPFRLIAIVNRIDLADNPAYGKTAGAGELRFVFGLTNNCQPTPFAVIFEYGVPPMNCLQLRQYAQKWTALSAQVPGTAAYNGALQAITDPIVKHGAGGAKPNGSTLNQLRTNEIFLTSPWELREFVIDPGSHLLKETTTKQTPIAARNNTLAVTDFVNANLAAVLNGTYVVPLQFPGATPFLSGNAPIPPNFWRGNPQIANNDARSQFSLGTCNGCHFGETNTPFVHINPNSPIGAPAALSGFLTGITLPDPVVPATQRSYNDLLNRKNKLNALASSPCIIRGLFFQPHRMVH